MRVPLSWIEEFAPVGDDATELAEELDDLGLVVEGISRVGEALADVVVARVEQIADIPGADRIRRVVVDAGGEPVEVVCGAWNFSEGDLVPLAPVGAVLPGGFEIARRKMKGVTSNGMLCSPRELELADDHRGILVLDAAGDRPPSPGEPLIEALGIRRGEVVFDLAVEANRPDAWSVAGVARDLAARRKVPFTLPDPPQPPAGPGAVADVASVEVVDLDLCPRFVARVITGIEVAPSPRWLTTRLTLAGMRPVSNVVDVSNYVMLELGQPTHPYDLDRLTGAGLRVRAARRGETLVTLDGVERRMGERSVGATDDRRDCVICDAADTAVGVAGVMGGASTEIGRQTRRVLLEAAYFTPMAVARTSKRLGLRTEASARFERGCDPAGIDRAVLRIIELLRSCAGGPVGEGAEGPSAAIALAAGSIDVRGRVPGPRPVTVRTDRVNAVLGTALGADDICGLLEPIGFGCDRGPGATLQVTVPTFRPDTEREIDVIEEVARHHGYSRIARSRPSAPQVGRLTDYQRRRRFVREVMAGLGADEAWTASLLAPGDHERTGRAGGVTVANPLVPDESVLRQTLLPGMLRALSSNAARRQGDIRLFEIGHVFPPPDHDRVSAALSGRRLSVVDEREVLALACAAPGDDAGTAAEAWYVLEDALGALDVEVAAAGEAGSVTPELAGLHPTRRARLVAPDGAHVGVVGEVDPDVVEDFGLDHRRQRVGWLEVDLGVLLGSVPRRSQLARAVSRFPSSDVDLAFEVRQDVPAAAVRRSLLRGGGELLESVSLFDVYRGQGLSPGTRSLAFRLRFCALDHTLDEDEIQALRRRCIEQVAEKNGGLLRS